MEITPKMMLSISKCISTHHLTTVGLHLNLTDHDIHQAEYAGKSECTYQILSKWKNLMGNMATIKTLLQCFLNAAMETAGSIQVESLTEALKKIQSEVE